MFCYAIINLRHTVCVSAQNFETVNHCHFFFLYTSAGPLLSAYLVNKICKMHFKYHENRNTIF
jgi:hypothetical protein